LVPILFVRKPYKLWKIYEANICWDDGSITLCKNVEFKIDDDKYSTNGEWYWAGWDSISPPFCGDLNLDKIFKTKMAGDIFEVTIYLRYSFDDEPEIEQVIKYSVETSKGIFRPPLLFT
jgi:hypothetical protein